jgi:hypothetical protein
MADATLMVAKINARHCRVFRCEGVREAEWAEVLFVSKLVALS